MKLTQREVTIRATVSTTVALEKLVESLESKNSLLRQTNEELFQHPLLLRKISSGAKVSLVHSAPNEFGRAAVKNENAVHMWCEREVLELAHYEKHF